MDKRRSTLGWFVGLLCCAGLFIIARLYKPNVLVDPAYRVVGSSKETGDYAVIKDKIVSRPLSTEMWLKQSKKRYDNAYFTHLEPRMLDSRSVVYNRVTKCGGRATMEIITKLATGKSPLDSTLTTMEGPISTCSNPEAAVSARAVRVTNASSAGHNISVIHGGAGRGFKYTENECKTFANELQHLPKPWIFHGHFYFVQLDNYGLEMPLYINIVRHPVARFVSGFYFKRNCQNKSTGRRFAKTLDECVLHNFTECSPNKQLFTTIKFFCGQREICLKPSRKALNIAKDNVHKYFGVIGLTEDLIGTYALLERTMPYYFSNMSTFGQVYLQQMKEKYKTVDKVIPSKHALAELERRMGLELEFYSFIKDRFEAFVRNYDTATYLTQR